MKKISYYSLISILLLVFQSCSSNKDCDICFTPPRSFDISIVDSETGENLFENGTLNPDQLQLEYSTEDSDQTRTNDGIYNNILSISSVGWKSEKISISVSVENNYLFTLYIDASRVSEDCCNFTRFNEIKFEDTTFEEDGTNGVYKVFIKP